jgi:HTH-type transcriptional regulator, sugar sensing transcriptional regulator
MPQLEAFEKAREATISVIQEFPSINGVKTVYDKLLTELKPGDDYFVISDQEKWYQLDAAYFENFIQQRAKLKLNIKLLLQGSAHAKQFQKKQAAYHEQIKILPAKIKLNINMVVTPHKVILVQIVEPISAMVIENNNVVQMHKALFNLLWSL